MPGLRQNGASRRWGVVLDRSGPGQSRENRQFSGP